MKAKKLFIHIGHFKSGTSSIQNFLWDNRGALNSAGFKYIETGITRDRSLGVRHYRLWRYIESENCLWPGVIDEMKNSEKNNFIISHEGLIKLTTAKVEYLKNLLSEFDVTIICYLRRQDLFIQSLYAEYIQNHGVDSCFETFLNQYGELCAYKILMTRWMKAFSKDKMIVKNFDKIIVESPCLEKNFCQSINLSLQEAIFKNIPVSNKTLCLEHLNEMYKLNHVEKDTKVRRLYSQELLKKTPAENRKGCFFSTTSIQPFMKKYQMGNRWVSDTFESFHGTFNEQYNYPDKPDKLRFSGELTASERK